MEFVSDIKPITWMNFIGCTFILIGLPFIYVTIKSIREDIASQSWPQTVAILQNIEVVKHIREGDSDDHYRKYVSYQCELTYQYQTVGKHFKAIKKERTVTREAALDLSHQHQLDETVPLYYNPKQPEQFRFKLISGWRGLIWLLPFAVFSGFGWGILSLGKWLYN